MPQVRKLVAPNGEPLEWSWSDKVWPEARQAIRQLAPGEWCAVELVEGDPEDLLYRLARALRYDAKVCGEPLRIQTQRKPRPIMYVQKIASLVVAPTVEPTPAQARRVPALRRRLMRRSEASP